MPAKTVRQAEKKALDGANESQDTLLVAHHLMMDFGVGLRSSSPPIGEMTALPPSPRRSRPSSVGADMESSVAVADKPAAETRGTRPPDTEQSQGSSIPETQDVGAPVNAPLWDAADGDGTVGDLNLPDTLPQSHDELVADAALFPKKKMDSTQEGSTQSNAGRSYDQYRRSSPAAPSQGSLKPPGSRSPAPGLLDDNDTSAMPSEHVNAVGTNKTVSSGQDDSGFVDFGSLARLQHVSPQKSAPSPTQYLPETPAPPQNPFRHSRSQLLPTSQLFRATQFSSPAKVASPTSSRPSPAYFPGNSISPNPVISSPLKARGLRSSPPVDITSSPDILPGTVSSKVDDAPTSPLNTTSTENPVVPESSHDGPARKRLGPDPMDTYEPMRKSQERCSRSERPCNPATSGDEDDDYDSIARMRKIRSRKDAAMKQLTAIRFSRPSKPDDVEVPSTSQRKLMSQAEAYIARCHGTSMVDNAEQGPDPPEEHQELHPRSAQQQPPTDEDATQSDGDEALEVEGEPAPTLVPELPRSSTVSAVQPFQNPTAEGNSNGEAIPETSPTSRRCEPLPQVAPPVETPAAEAESTPNFQSSPPAFSTRSRKARAGARYPRAPSPTSSLSNLASTPQLPPSNSPATAGSAPAGSPTESTIVASSSPAIVQTKRRNGRSKPTKLKTASTESLRQSTRAIRRGSTSTDELSRSASATPTFEQSLRVSRLSISRSASRSGRATAKPPPTQRDPKLFDNMAFAISFQSRKPGESNEQYTARTEFSATIHKLIRQAGGRILENGFDELFDVAPMGGGGTGGGTTPTSSATNASDPSPPPHTTTTPPSPDSPPPEDEIHLTAEGRTTGFTALIADGHSRKVKYMQALALGLPCLAARWVTACIRRGELVDWAPYLLCAGQSAFLGDAMRSRSLVPYDACGAKLAEVVGRRERLLRGKKVLAVVKRAAEGRKMAYVFLARVLGAALTRAYSVEEARGEMRAAEAGGCRFDWVYVDGKGDEEALFAGGGGGAAVGGGQGAGGGKKRKRVASTAAAGGAGAGAGAGAAGPPMKRIRTLSDELVIQSLILGRLIEEGEMDG